MSHTAAVLAELPRHAAEDLLARLDRVVPGRIAGFYVVGSARGVPPRRLATSGVLGAPRLQYTIATGEIATKEAARDTPSKYSIRDGTG